MGASLKALFRLEREHAYANLEERIALISKIITISP